jgi:hypothetical protein
MFHRHIEPLVHEALADTPVVVVHGARQTGKSTLVRALAQQTGRSYLTLDDGAVVPIYGIFDNEYVEPMSMESSGPAFTCGVADVPAVAHGKALIINGTTYLVRGVKPDGTGVVALKLEEQ